MIDRSDWQRSLKESISSENLRRHLEWLSKVRRDTGGPGEKKTAEYLAAELKSHGVQYRLHEFDAFLSYPIRATLEVLEPEHITIRALTHSFGRSTGPVGVIASLRYLPDGNMNHGAGRAAMVDGLLSPIKVLDATRAGVSALIFANDEWYIHNMIGTTIWGTPTISQLDRLPDIPVISINHEGGQTLRRLLQEGPVTVKVTTEVNTGWFPSLLPEAIIPGTQEPEKFVLVGGHYCAWEVGITDNATGNACLLEIARVLNQHREHLTRSVRVAWWPGHSHGRYSGSTWYADNFWEDMARNCIVYHNIDSPGVRGATQYVVRQTTAEVERFGQEMITLITGQTNSPKHRPSRAADQSFLATGVPSFSCYPFLPEDHPDRKPWTGGSAMGWWWHTEHDTLNKADIDILTTDTRLSCTAVAELCQCTVLPMDFEAVAREVTAVLADLAEAAQGHLDFGRLLEKVPALSAATAALAKVQAVLSKEGGDKARVSRLNRVLMRLSRILTPVIYSSGGRFTHDPADMTPIMRAGTKSLFPTLSKAAGLPALSGKHEYGFLRTEVRREMNRVGDALDQAVEVIENAIGN